MTKDCAFETATAGDYDAVRSLLAGCSLPADGRGRAAYGLLRSVAVSADARSRHLGARLVENRLEWARSQGL